MSNQKQKEATDKLYRVAKRSLSYLPAEEIVFAEVVSEAITAYEKALQEEPEKEQPEKGLSSLSFADLYAMRSYIVSVHQITSGEPEFVDLHLMINQELHNRIEQLKGGKS